MYAAVLNQLGQIPCYAPLAKPEVQTAEQQLLKVEAASVIPPQNHGGYL